MKRFLKNKLAMLGLCVVVFFFLLAIFAPFLANNRPLILSREEGLSFPVFSGFSAQDFLWLSVFMIPLICAPIRAHRKKIAGLALLTAIVIASFWDQGLDQTDYPSMGDQVGFCLMPPIPYSPGDFDSSNRFQPPCGAHWLGTDEMGRDILSRLIHGARISMLVGFVAVTIYIIIGIVIGALAGYFGGVTDLALCRFMEVVICFPVFFAILAVFCFLPPSIYWIMILIGLFRWPGAARLIRGEFLRLKNEEFVLASQALGMSHFRIIFVQILPNSLAPVLVAATFGVAGAILMESGLSFLGFGVQPPTPSWGKMLADGREAIGIAWGLTVFPGMAIFLVVSAFNLVGEGLRDALDPKLKGGS